VEAAVAEWIVGRPEWFYRHSIQVTAVPAPALTPPLEKGTYSFGYGFGDVFADGNGGAAFFF
jgi:hypothetical protein